MLPVWMMNSPFPDEFGVAQYCVPAVAYIAQDKWIAKGTEYCYSVLLLLLAFNALEVV